MISSIGKSTRHVSCLYSEGEAIKPIYHVKLVAKYAFSLRAPSNIKNRLAGSGGDSRTGALASSHCWYSLTMSSRLAAASSNSNSSIPSLMNKWRYAFLEQQSLCVHHLPGKRTPNFSSTRGWRSSSSRRQRPTSTTWSASTSSADRAKKTPRTHCRSRSRRITEE